MKVLVTGGAGFIGSHIVELGLARGHEVTVLDNLSSGSSAHVPAGVKLLQVDLRDRAATLNAVAASRPDAVSHQAGQVSVSASVEKPLVDAEINIIGSLNLLDACLKCAVPRFVFASTGGAIYGEVPAGTRATTATATCPESPYAIGKLTIEHYLRIHNQKQALRSFSLRYANVYGPRQGVGGESGVVSIFLARACRGEALAIHGRDQLGDEGCIRDYIYVADIARANWLALEGQIDDALINLGTGTGTSTQFLANSLATVMGQSLRTTFAAPRADDLRRSVLDPEALLSVLGAFTPLDVGLSETVRWYDEHRGPPSSL